MKALRKGKEVTGSSDSDDDAPMGDSYHTTTPAGIRTTQDVRGGCKKASLARGLQNAHENGKDGEMPDRTRWCEPRENGDTIMRVQVHELIGML